jgi:hypothetical protein
VAGVWVEEARHQQLVALLEKRQTYLGRALQAALESSGGFCLGRSLHLLRVDLRNYDVTQYKYEYGKA